MWSIRPAGALGEEGQPIPRGRMVDGQGRRAPHDESIDDAQDGGLVRPLSYVAPHLTTPGVAVQTAGASPSEERCGRAHNLRNAASPLCARQCCGNRREISWKLTDNVATPQVIGR